MKRTKRKKRARRKTRRKKLVLGDPRTAPPGRILQGNIPDRIDLAFEMAKARSAIRRIEELAQQALARLEEQMQEFQQVWTREERRKDDLYIRIPKL